MGRGGLHMSCSANEGKTCRCVGLSECLGVSRPVEAPVMRSCTLPKSLLEGSWCWQCLCSSACAMCRNLGDNTCRAIAKIDNFDGAGGSVCQGQHTS